MIAAFSFTIGTKTGPLSHFYCMSSVTHEDLEIMRQRRDKWGYLPFRYYWRSPFLHFTIVQAVQFSINFVAQAELND